MAVYRGSRENKNSLTEVKFCERHWHYHCIQKVRKRTSPSLKIVTVGKSQLAQYVKWVVLFESCLLQLTGIHLWKVTLTYPVANIQSRPSFQNRRVVWVYSQTSIRSSTISSAVICRIIFEQTFKKYSYPQIRNVFVMESSISLPSGAARRFRDIERYCVQLGSIVYGFRLGRRSKWRLNGEEFGWTLLMERIG